MVGKKKKDIHMKIRLGQQQPITILTYVYALQVTIGYTVIFNALK